VAGNSSVEERITTARHFRVFPGEGVHSQEVAALTLKLHQMGYRGDYSFEVFNDDYQAMPLGTVARRARQSALWLGESVLRRSVPLPNQMRLRACSGQRASGPRGGLRRQESARCPGSIRRSCRGGIKICRHNAPPLAGSWRVSRRHRSSWRRRSWRRWTARSS
jgi:hypothetical protein